MNRKYIIPFAEVGSLCSMDEGDQNSNIGGGYFDTHFKRTPVFDWQKQKRSCRAKIL